MFGFTPQAGLKMFLAHFSGDAGLQRWKDTLPTLEFDPDTIANLLPILKATLEHFEKNC